MRSRVARWPWRPLAGRRPFAILSLLCLVAVRQSWSAQAPVSLALVIDESGSLSPQELNLTRGLAESVFASLPSGSEAAVFSFDDQARLIHPLTSNPDEVHLALGQLKVSGHYTALYDALYDASRYLRDAGQGRRAILLVTDGKDENSALVLEDGLRVAEDNGIPIFAVGVGRVEERVLRRIAKLTSGQFMPIGTAKAATLAELLLAPVPPSASASPAAGPPPTTLKVATAAAKTPTPAAPNSRGDSKALWLGLLLVAALAGALVLMFRARARPRCPSCDRELPGPLASCGFCSAADTILQPAAGPAVSETVVTRLNITEEYLEKTVTLRERPVLVVTRGSKPGQVVLLSLEASTSIGRAKANDIVLDDLAVSSQHCRIRPEDGHFVLHDLKSTNGTFLNERRVMRQPLAEGDVVKVGETTLQFRREQRMD
jgi:hypothetical protein